MEQGDGSSVSFCVAWNKGTVHPFPSVSKQATLKENDKIKHFFIAGSTRNPLENA
jgi:hypothetical protein